MKYFIMSTADSFEVIPETKYAEHKGELVAIHESEELAEAGLKRAQELEKSLRPMLISAELAARAVRSHMLKLVWAEAGKCPSQP